MDDTGVVAVTDPAAMIRKLGDPELRAPSQAVTEGEIGGPELTKLLADLTAAMRAAHGLGIAAPQIGVLKRVFLIEVADNPRYPDAPRLELMAFLNPVVRPLGDEVPLEEAFEGCLSVPGLRGPVRRFASVRIDGLDPAGRPVALALHGPFARIAQHEVDHLDGILYLDRIAPESLSRLGFRDALAAAGVDLGIQRGTAPAWSRLEPEAA